MTGCIVDSNVLIDVLNEDPVWAGWSAAALADAADTRQLIVNQIIFSEVSIGLDHLEQLDAVFPTDLFRREDLPWDAAFVAGKAFLAYRRRGGVRNSPLPDFFIGAHATVRGHAILTRDPSGYRTYFPTVELFAPG